MSSITICLSLGQFASFCAFAPALTFIDDFGLDVDWRALPPSPRPVTPAPLPDDPLAEYEERRKQARDQWARREFERDCERLGLDVDRTPRSVDATAGDAGLQFVADHGGDVRRYAEGAFHRAFVEGRALAAPRDISDLVDASGFEVWVEREGQARLAAVESELGEAGVFAAPAFILEGEVFQGRQHFPLMRWIVSGREGPPPV
ncbi:MAG: hypothetical protein U5O39_06480 [Gammaproteobacteria bacterium]|nr:hypothetical protein [Gammaproteobacteria bacterium]